jgi:hypothetical protein
MRGFKVIMLVSGTANFIDIARSQKYCAYSILIYNI